MESMIDLRRRYTLNSLLRGYRRTDYQIDSQNSQSYDKSVHLGPSGDGLWEKSGKNSAKKSWEYTQYHDRRIYSTGYARVYSSRNHT